MKSVLALLLLLAAGGAQALPASFGDTIGSAVLCRSHLENKFFYHYLSTHFGPPYKREGGAYWFKAEASLWGQPVRELMVSDDTNELVFVAAVADTNPEKLAEAVRAGAGVRYPAANGSTYPLRISNPGSVIAYHNTKSKIYCARYKPLPPGR